MPSQFLQKIFYNLFVCLIFIQTFSLNLNAQSLYFPPLVGKEWETTNPTTLSWNTAQIDSLYQLLNENNTKAFIVLKDGKIVIEKYFGTFQQDSIWQWASAGKTITSFLIGVAQQENFLRISDTVSKWIGNGWTNLPTDKEKLITIRHQLTMTTGLDDDVSDLNCTDKQCLIFKSDAGTRWAYHTAPYTLLDTVIRSATGKTINQYFNLKVQNKTGINGAFIKLNYNNIFFSTARSMARFGLLILNKGRWNQTEILSDTNYYNEMINTSQNFNLSYGYLWWLNGKQSFMLPQTQLIFPGSLSKNAPPDMFAALGKNDQILNIAPSMNLVVVRMGESANNSFVSTIFQDKIWEKLNLITNRLSDIKKTNEQLNGFELHQNYPNPFNPSTKIHFQLPTTSFVSLKIYDVMGKEVSTLIDRKLEKGNYNITFEAKNLSAGVYFYTLKTGKINLTRKMFFVK